MQHRDKTILLKISAEIGVALDMVGNTGLSTITK